MNAVGAMINLFVAESDPDIPWRVIVQGFGFPEQYDEVSGALTSTRNVKLPLYGTVTEGDETYAPPFME